MDAIDEINTSFISKDTFVFGVHSSGYILPLKIHVKKQINIDQNAEFIAWFREQKYIHETGYILIDCNGIVEGITPGIPNNNIVQ